MPKIPPQLRGVVAILCVARKPKSDVSKTWSTRRLGRNGTADGEANGGVRVGNESVARESMRASRPVHQAISDLAMARS